MKGFLENLFGWRAQDPPGTVQTAQWEGAVKIAVLDDSDADRERIAALIRKHLEEEREEYELRTYSSPQEFLWDVKGGVGFDLYFLDMELSEKDGIQVAEELRRLYFMPCIIFVTNHVEYAPLAFEVNAFRYLPKNLYEERVGEALRAVLPVVKARDQRFYVYQHYNDVERIWLRNIYYLEKAGSYVDMHLRERTISIRKPMKTVLAELDAPEFILAQRDIAANVLHIMSIRKGELLMRNGKTIPLSRNREEDVREKVLEYWSMEKSLTGYYR